MKKVIEQKPKDLLTDDELALLQKVIEEPIDIAGIKDIFLSNPSKQMLKVLAESEDIILVTYRQQEEFRFPLYFSHDDYVDELKELGPPDIIEHGLFKGEGVRYWRLCNPQGVKVFDQTGEYLLGCVINISTSGMFMLSTDEQYDYIYANMQVDDYINFYLKIPHLGFHLISANIVRIESDYLNKKGLALNFKVNQDLGAVLHEYIMDKHDTKSNVI